MEQGKRSRRGFAKALAVASAVATLPIATAAQTLSALRERGSIRVAMYKDFPPFQDHGHGIDVDLGQALAARLGLRFEPMTFDAGEDVRADLRNMVLETHYLGRGPADLMLHVPVDPALAQENPKLRIIAPYMRENIVIARDRRAIPALDSLAPFAVHRIGVDGASVSALVMLGAENGRYRDQVAVYPGSARAIEAARAGEVSAVMGLRSELQAALGRDARFALSLVPAPQVPAGGWVLGMAVRASATELARAVEAAVDAMAVDGQIERIFTEKGVQWMRP